MVFFSTSLVDVSPPQFGNFSSYEQIFFPKIHRQTPEPFLRLLLGCCKIFSTSPRAAQPISYALAFLWGMLRFCDRTQSPIISRDRLDERDGIVDIAPPIAQ
ncbi:hypothetical protein QUA82_05215 [Microcoleus sp. F8-D3]